MANIAASTSQSVQLIKLNNNTILKQEANKTNTRLKSQIAISVSGSKFNEISYVESTSINDQNRNLETVYNILFEKLFKAQQ